MGIRGISASICMGIRSISASMRESVSIAIRIRSNTITQIMSVVAVPGFRFGFGLRFSFSLTEGMMIPKTVGTIVNVPESWYSHYGHNLGYGVASYPYGNGYALPYARTYANYAHTYSPYAYGGLRTYAYGK
jgi:hypothetical protein